MQRVVLEPPEVSGVVPRDTTLLPYDSVFGYSDDDVQVTSSLA